MDRQPVDVIFAISLLLALHFQHCRAAGCDETLVSSSGNFKSPGYPSSSLSNKQCAYSIKVPAGNTIQLDFIEFSLGQLGCVYASLKIYEGSSASGQPVLTKCAKSRNSFISQGNELYIVFKAVYMTGPGFKVNFAARNGCELVFNTNESSFASPKYPLNYPDDVSCSYRISGPVGSRIALVFSNFALESSAGCTKDRLEIYNGIDAAGTMIARRCGRNTTQFSWNGNKLFLRFITDASVNDEGFLIHFYIGQLGCSKVLNSSFGNITSPSYPSHYPNNARCSYKINVPRNMIVLLKFHHFSLTGYNDKDRLRIYEGADESGLLTDSRHWAINYPYISLSNNLFLTFQSDSTGTSTGFKIEFTALSGCNLHLTDVNGLFTSPLYPYNYPNNTVCNYTITVAMGFRIHLYFPKFALEKHDSCLNDNLRIYEGPDMKSPLGEMLCGEYENKQFISATNQLFLQLTTNDKISKNGFHANYYTTRLSCDQTFTASSGEIKSSYFPNNYPNNAQCTYVVRGRTGNKIQLIFSEFSVVQSKNCSADSLTIYSEKVSNVNILSKRCGNQTSTILSLASTIHIVFQSDMTRASRGYQIFYQVGPEGCGGVFTANEGRISSPAISSKYPNNALCRYKIIGPVGKKINLIFSEFSLQYHEACKYDSLKIYEGSSAQNGTLSETRCGSTVTAFQSTSNELYMVLATDSSEALAGFIIYYHIDTNGCDKRIRDSTGSIASPFSPSPYPNNAFCTYAIEVPEGLRVELTFQRFMLQACCSGKECDTVKIYDGSDSKGTLINTLCGTKHSLKQNSTTNKIFIEFRSDGIQQNYGFQATFKALSPGICVKTKPCQNNGTCKDVGTNSYKCECIPKYTGINCTEKVIPCASNPCFNGGHCFDRFNASSAVYECICRPGFTGPECQTRFDECDGYIAEDKWQRSVAHIISPSDSKKNCDISLTSSWYRFTSKAGPDMPTTCPPMHSCGTSGSIWINDSFPVNAGDYKNVTACLRDEKKCCSTSWNIVIKKCLRNSTIFHVYQLIQTPSCPMAYCAGTEVPCQNGWNSPTGFTPGCTNDFPIIFPMPNVSPAIRDNRLEFRCKFQSNSTDPNGRFEVTWYEGSPSNQINKTDILKGSERVAILRNSDSQKLFRLGTTIFCRVRSWYEKNTRIKFAMSQSYESNRFFAGIRFESQKRKYTTTEASRPLKLKLINTVPIVCPAGESCKVLIESSQSNSEVFLNTCSLELNSGPANRTAILEIVAKRDFIADGRKIVRIRIKIIGKGDWNDHHEVDIVIIIVEDVQTERCTSSGDPHMISFDKLYFNHYKLGDYVLVNSTCRLFEVHVRTWKCAAVTCNCGIAAREGNDVIVIDMCKDGVPRARFASKGKPASGTSLTRDINGKSFLIEFPSGAFVRFDNYPWYGNVYYANIVVQVPSDDFNCTVGLCGNFDRNKHNDMKSKDGTVHTTMQEGLQAPVGFTESWKLPKGSSLFYYKDKTDACKKTASKKNCICTRDSSDKIKADCIFASYANRPMYPLSGSGWRKLRPSSWKSCVKRQRRDISTDITLREDDDIFDYEYDPPQLNFVAATWPTKSGKSQSQVERYCENEVKNSEAGRICSAISYFNFSSYVQQCIEDIQITDNYAFSTSAIRSMQDACEEIFLKNMTFWKADQSKNGTIGPPVDIANTFCPGLCSGNGKCVNATCQCYGQWTSPDCSIDGTKGPTLLSVGGNGLCDVRTSINCNIIRITGYNFMETANLSCRATKIEVKESGYDVTGDESVSKAVLLSFAEVYCQLKNHSVQITDKSAKNPSSKVTDGILIEVTNNGLVYSSTKLPYIVFDSKCMQCNGTIGSCRIRANMCNINGNCLNAGESSKSDKCSKCDPGRSQTIFTKDYSCADGSNKSQLVVIAVSVSVAVLLVAVMVGFIVFKLKCSRSVITSPSNSVELKEKHSNPVYTEN